MQNLTAIYYTADKLPKNFSDITKYHLMKAVKAQDIYYIELHQDPMIKPSHIQIYRNALKGAYLAKTKYIALCEDDILYHEDHFRYRPTPGVFAYNMSVWSIYTWVQPALFSYKDRRNLSQLICERDLFIEAMEERFKKYPDEKKINLGLWSEPGKYERQLGVTERLTEKFYTDIPNVAFSHETALSFQNLGTRKRLGHLRVTALPYWNSAQEVLQYYV